MVTKTDPTYVNFLTKVVTKFGLNPNQQIDVNDPMTKLTMAIAIATAEQGRDNYSYDQYVKGLAKGMGIDPGALDKELNPTQLGIENNSGTTGFVSPASAAISTGGGSITSVNISGYISAGTALGPLPTITLPNSISSAISSITTPIGNAIQSVKDSIFGASTAGAVNSAISTANTNGNNFIVLSMGSNDPNAGISPAVTQQNVNSAIQGAINAGYSPGNIFVTVPALQSARDPVIQAIAATPGVRTLDAGAVANDGLHPTGAGYAQLANQVTAVVGSNASVVGKGDSLVSQGGITDHIQTSANLTVTTQGDVGKTSTYILQNQIPNLPPVTSNSFNPLANGFTAQVINQNGTTTYTNPTTGDTLIKQTNGSFTDTSGAVINTSGLIPTGTTITGDTYNALYNNLPFQGAKYTVTNPYFVSSDGSGAYREITGNNGLVYYQNVQTGTIYDSADNEIATVAPTISPSGGPASDIATIPLPVPRPTGEELAAIGGIPAQTTDQTNNTSLNATKPEVGQPASALSNVPMLAGSTQIIPAGLNQYPTPLSESDYYNYTATTPNAPTYQEYRADFLNNPNSPAYSYAYIPANFTQLSSSTSQYPPGTFTASGPFGPSTPVNPAAAVNSDTPTVQTDQTYGPNLGTSTFNYGNPIGPGYPVYSDTGAQVGTYNNQNQPIYVPSIANTIQASNLPPGVSYVPSSQVDANGQPVGYDRISTNTNLTPSDQAAQVENILTQDSSLQPGQQVVLSDNSTYTITAGDLQSFQSQQASTTSNLPTFATLGLNIEPQTSSPPELGPTAAGQLNPDPTGPAIVGSSNPMAPGNPAAAGSSGAGGGGGGC